MNFSRDYIWKINTNTNYFKDLYDKKAHKWLQITHYSRRGRDRNNAQLIIHKIKLTIVIQNNYAILNLSVCKKVVIVYFNNIYVIAYNSILKEVCLFCKIRNLFVTIQNWQYLQCQSHPEYTWIHFFTNVSETLNVRTSFVNRKCLFQSCLA